jgi:plastocyanin
MCSRFLLVLAVLIGTTATVESSSAVFHEVTITETAFVPFDLYTVVGDTVRWVNESGSVQTVTTGEPCQAYGPLDSGDIEPDGYFECVIDFGGAGDMYDYFSRHTCPGLTGVLFAGPDMPVQQTTWGKIRALYH